MHRGKQLVTIIAGLSVAGLSWAQGTQPSSSPGTVPVPKSSTQPGFNGAASGAPASTPAKTATATKPAAKKPAEISNTKRFAESTGLTRTSEVMGLSVKDVADKDAGKIEDLLVDLHGKVSYAIVSFGGLLGIGDKLYAVPWDAMVIDREHKTAYLDVDKETLEGAELREGSLSRPERPRLGEQDARRVARRHHHGEREVEARPREGRHPPQGQRGHERGRGAAVR
jgi:hypothetical protein